VSDLDLDDLIRIADSSTTSAFRLETLPQYLVPQEVDELAQWRAGVRELRRTAWLTQVRESTERGYRRYRARILDYPLCEYSEFELFGYQANQAAGEEIYVADRASNVELDDLHVDFWLYDDEIAIRMIYDDEGHFIRPEVLNDIQRYRDIRDRALRHTVELDEYLRTREPRLIA
jgi:hypothetical protein